MAAKVGDYDLEAQLGGRLQGVELRPGAELRRLKDDCVGRRLLRAGSVNFSRSGETRQDNGLVALRGSACARFDAKFNGLGAEARRRKRSGGRDMQPASLTKAKRRSAIFSAKNDRTDDLPSPASRRQCVT